MKRFAAVLTVVLFYPLNSAPAAPSRQSASEIPVLDIRPVCRGITSQSSDPGVGQGGQAQTFQQCVESERAVLEQIKQEWGTFAAEDKRHCVALATTGGESSNTELLTCLEMARDVRLLRSAATAAPSRGETTKSESSASSRAALPSSAMSAPQLAPPPSPRAPAAERPSEVGANTSKERADAQAADASAASLRRELVEAKAALQLAKEEAGRATTEADRAKADAKAARDSETAAKRKLADAETARAAAEKACPSSPKPRPFERLRQWLRPGKNP
jgi:pyruvate/2-oxoglutarate dehydrogenase complex dihydrolipoamide acyltransferase (E2) component